ncbi:MAG TPA: hypothetical protein DDW52_06885, partial [Planctomycetaceae bacterium]|nr:hypothetical protein [Planctomycetaceae bacterium]
MPPENDESQESPIVNEGKTTAIFAIVAAVSFGLAYWSAPRALMDEDALKTTVVGKAIFEKFDDPGTAQSLEIVKFNEEMATISRFEVAKDSETKIWTLPSFDDYPADAEEQIRDATTPLIGLQVLSVESVESGSHSLYGVVNPDDRDLSVAESGVGMLLTVKGAENQILASLVVGKEVEGAANQRYVRVPSEDAVYVVELDSAPFTTEFGDWIDKKLLEVRSFDITSIQLRDYALFPTENSYAMRRNFDADFTYQPTASSWSLDRLLTYEGATSTETELPPGESLNEQALNDLRNAVQDLEIVDVRRKPDGLAADLKADKSLLDNQESLRSLYAQGFIPQPVGDSYEIFSTGGETIIGTDDGVQYNLRFGESDASLGASTDDEEENSEQGLRRYLLVTASLDESKFPTPDLEIVPQTVEEMQAMQAEESGATESGPADSGPESAAGTGLGMEPPAEASSTDPADESTG